jgi:hypothetical protein
MKKPQIKSPSCKGLFNCLSFDDSFQKFRRSGFSYNLAEEYAAQNDEEIPLYSASLISLGNRKGFLNTFLQNKLKAFANMRHLSRWALKV